MNHCWAFKIYEKGWPLRSQTKPNTGAAVHLCRFSCIQVHEINRGDQDVRFQDQRAQREGVGGYDPLPQQRGHVLHQAEELQGRQVRRRKREC